MIDLITIQRTVARMQRNHSLVAAVTATGTWPHYPESSCRRCKKACAHFTCWFPVWVYRSAAAAFKCCLVSELCSDPLAILIPIIEVRDKSLFFRPLTAVRRAHVILKHFRAWEMYNYYLSPPKDILLQHLPRSCMYYPPDKDILLPYPLSRNAHSTTKSPLLSIPICILHCLPYKDKSFLSHIYPNLHFIVSTEQIHSPLTSATALHPVSVFETRNTQVQAYPTIIS